MIAESAGKRGPVSDKPGRTDPESGIMKTSNEGFQQCYNAQVAVDGDHQLVVATEMTANASDQGGLPVLLDEVSETFGEQTLLYVKNAMGSTTESFAREEQEACGGYSWRTLGVSGAPETGMGGLRPLRGTRGCLRGPRCARKCLPRARSPAAVKPLRGSSAPALRVTAAADRAGSPCGPAGRLALDPLPASATSGCRLFVSLTAVGRPRKVDPPGAPGRERRGWRWSDREPLGRTGAVIEFGRHRLFLRPEWIRARARKQAQEQEKMPDSTVGIDISKTHLDTYMAPAGKAARFTNDAAGFNALIAWIESPVRLVVYEPTGPWHRAFEE